MQVQCPGCGKTLNAPDALAGRVVKCPGCGGQMQLPEAEVPEAAPPPAPAQAPTRVPTRAPAPSPAPPPRPGSKRMTGATGTKPCPYCGEAIQATAVKCRHCGETLSAPRRRQQMAGGQLVASYQAGMRGLSVALIVLGLLAILRGVVGLVMLRRLMGELGPEEGAITPMLMVVMAVILGVGAIYFLLGFFAWRLHNWVNWLVGIVSGLGVVLSGLGLVAMGGIDIGTAVGLVVMLALLITCFLNISKRSRLRAAGIDPRAAAGRPRAAPASSARGRTSARAAAPGRTRSRIRR